MVYTYSKSPSGDTLHVTRCDEGHLQLVVRSGIGETTVPVCIAPEHVNEVLSEMRSWSQVAAEPYCNHDAAAVVDGVCECGERVSQQ